MNSLKNNPYKLISLTLAKNTIFILLVVLFFEFFLFQMPVLAASMDNSHFNELEQNSILEIKIDRNANIEAIFEDKNQTSYVSVVVKDHNNDTSVQYNVDKNENIGDHLNTENFNNLPPNNDLKIKKYKYIQVTAYTSESSQTDSSPCITANGYNLCENKIEDTIAANFLPFGTKVRMPEVFGDRIFYVRDRMNSRYQSRVDVWMKDKNSALKFGIKKTKIEVLE